MTFTLSSGALRLALTVPQGSSYAAADGAATGLAKRLTDATERPASVTVSPRREPIEVYA